MSKEVDWNIIWKTTITFPICLLKVLFSLIQDIFYCHSPTKLTQQYGFLEEKKFNQYFVCMGWLFSRSFKSCALPYTILSFYLLLEITLILIRLYETLLLIPFSVIGQCFLVLASHWLLIKWARINLSQVASGTILQKHS